MSHKEHDVSFKAYYIAADGAKGIYGSYDTQPDAARELSYRDRYINKPDQKRWIERHEVIVDVVWATGEEGEA